MLSISLNHFIRRDTESPTEFDSNNNLKASFEQLSNDRINDESNKNLAMLKSLETIIQERVQSFAVFLVRFTYYFVYILSYNVHTYISVYIIHVY